MSNKPSELEAPRRSPFLAWQPMSVALAITGLCLFYTGGFMTQATGDGEHYRNIATGQWHQVPSPFSARFLGPLLVRGAAATGIVSVDWGFALLSGISCFVVAWLVAAVALQATGSAAVALIMLAGTVIPEWWFAPFGPEALHAALLCGFLLLLRRLGEDAAWPGTLLAMLLLVLMTLTREASALIGLILVFILWFRGGRARAMAWLVVTLAGVMLDSWIAQRAGTGNIHQMPPLAYMAAKVPFNGLRNLMGVRFWVNTFAEEPPATRWQLPSWARIGSIREIGLMPWEIMAVRHTLLGWLCVFGVLPGIAWFMWRRRRRDGAQSPAWLKVSACYGAISFLIAPLLGAAVGRLVGYGWPVFWIALPLALARRMGCWAFRTRAMAIIGALHLVSSWLVLTGSHPLYWKTRVGQEMGRVPLYETIAICVGLIAQVVTYKLLVRLDGRSELAGREQ